MSRVSAHLTTSYGQGRGIPDEKALSGSPPHPAQPGVTLPDGGVAPVPRETQRAE